MHRFPIRIKLAIALAVPLVAMGLVTLIEVTNVAADAREVRDQTGLATATIGPNGLITALQNERNWAAAQLVGVDQDLAMEVSGYEQTRAETDAALAEFEAGLDERSPAARSAYDSAIDDLSALEDLRAEIDGYVATTTPSLANMPLTTGVFDQYTELIAQFFGGMSRISVAMDDPELRQGARLMEAVSRQLETVPQLTNALALPASVPSGPGDEPGVNQPEEIAKVARLENAFRRQAETLRSPAGAYAELAAEHFPEQFDQTLADQTALALSTGKVDLPTLLAGLDMPDLDDTYLGYRDAVATALAGRADELNAAATSRQQRFAALMVVTLGAAAVLTVIVSLSITRPLRSLTAAGQGDGRPAAARRGVRDPRHPAGRGRRGADGGPGPGEDARRGRGRGRGAEHGAGLGARPGRGAGGAAPQHRRQLREPRPAQPEPAGPAARLHHPARDERDRLRQPGQPVPARPPGHPHAPQRRVAAGAGGHRAAPPVGRTASSSPTSSAPPSARSRTTSGWSAAASSTPP